MYDPKSGYSGPCVVWSSGRLALYRHCDAVYELLCDGEPVMPVNTFERLTAYLWAEFDVLPPNSAKRSEW